VQGGGDQVGRNERARAGDLARGLLGLEEHHSAIALVGGRALDHGLVHHAELDVVGLSAGGEQADGGGAVE